MPHWRPRAPRSRNTFVRRLVSRLPEAPPSSELVLPTPLGALIVRGTSVTTKGAALRRRTSPKRKSARISKTKRDRPFLRGPAPSWNLWNARFVWGRPCYPPTLVTVAPPPKKIEKYTGNIQFSLSLSDCTVWRHACVIEFNDEILRHRVVSGGAYPGKLYGICQSVFCDLVVLVCISKTERQRALSRGGLMSGIFRHALSS